MSKKFALVFLLLLTVPALAVISNFSPSLARILVHEGGWNYCDKRDPGSCTLNGITEARWKVFLQEEGRPYSPLGPHLLKSPQWRLDRETIYERYYASPCGFHHLARGLDYVVLDYCVHSGYGRGGRAVRCSVQTAFPMRECMRVSSSWTIDEPIIEAAGSIGAKVLIRRICDEREAFLRSLPTFRHFGTGWMSRLRSVCRAGALMTEVRGASGYSIPAKRGPGKAYEFGYEEMEP